MAPRSLEAGGAVCLVFVIMFFVLSGTAFLFGLSRDCGCGFAAQGIRGE